MGQIGIRIINIVLFSTSCFFSAGVFNHIADHQLAPDYASTMKPMERAVSKEPTWQERSSILERNLFGAKVAGSATPPPQKVEPPPPPPEEEAKETRLPIELLGTLAAEPAEFSTAAINNTRLKKHQVVRVGDLLEGFDEVKVTAIEPRRVLLSNRNVIEELLLEKDEGGTKRTAAAPRPSNAGRGALDRLRDRKSRRKARQRPSVVTPADGAETSEAEEAIEATMTQTLIRDLEPAYDDGGQITGVKVGEIEPDSVLSRAGLSADDVITNLNGIDIDSAGAAARVMREMSKCQPMTGSVDSAGGTRTIEIGQDLLAELNCPN